MPHLLVVLTISVSLSNRRRSEGCGVGAGTLRTTSQVRCRIGMQVKSGKSELFSSHRRGPETNLCQYAMTIEAS